MKFSKYVGNKLALNKITVARLDNKEMADIIRGGLVTGEMSDCNTAYGPTCWCFTVFPNPNPGDVKRQPSNSV
ncbi:MAG: hypothetical protein GY757_28375 [bacterium]|nr:hypothetical protein [bacterium]